LDQGAQLPFVPIRVGEWWTPDGSDQVDIVALGTKRELLIGECKAGRVTSADLDKLASRARAVAQQLGNVGHVYTALFTMMPVRGKQLAPRLAADDVHLITAGALFGAP
jgi:hypothetical protein